MSYYDDRFHPSEINDTEEDFKKATTLQNIKSLDPHFHKYKKMVTLDNVGKVEDTFTRKIAVEYYSSGPVGTFIRNAQTGVYTKDLVGSKQEDFYFKVRLGNGQSQTLFYDSPEQYEKHHREKLSVETKENWFKKRVLFQQLSIQ